MQFEINIASEHVVMTDDGASEQLANIVADVAEAVRDGSRGGTLRDASGNKVGTWHYDPDAI